MNLMEMMSDGSEVPELEICTAALDGFEAEVKLRTETDAAPELHKLGITIERLEQDIANLNRDVASQVDIIKAHRQTVEELGADRKASMASSQRLRDEIRAYKKRAGKGVEAEIRGELGPVEELAELGNAVEDDEPEGGGSVRA